MYAQRDEGVHKPIAQGFPLQSPSLVQYVSGDVVVLVVRALIVVVLLVVVVGVGHGIRGGWRRQRRMSLVGGTVTTFLFPIATVTVSGTQVGIAGQSDSTKVQTPLHVSSASHVGPHAPPTTHARSDSLRARTPSRQPK